MGNDLNCGNCKFFDEYSFCEKLVLDTKRTFVENNKPIKAYYISERDGDDDYRTSFIVPSNFCCNLHILK